MKKLDSQVVEVVDAVADVVYALVPLVGRWEPHGGDTGGRQEYGVVGNEPPVRAIGGQVPREALQEDRIGGGRQSAWDWELRHGP